MTNSTISVPRPPGERTKPARLALDDISLDDRLQSRDLKPAVVKDYLAILRRGEELPAVRVVRGVNDDYYLVDGYHTVAATRERLGLEDIAVETIDGTFDDALWLSWGANRNHGLRRAQKDIRRAIQAAVKHPRWKLQSDRTIAQHIGCDHKTIGAMRRKCVSGEFSTHQGCPGSRRLSGPSKRQILQACRLLAKVQPEQAGQFSSGELAMVRAGYEPLHRLLHGASTLRLKKPRVEEERPEGGRNECEQAQLSFAGIRQLRAG
jgi:hypothetical protein